VRYPFVRVPGDGVTSSASVLPHRLWLGITRVASARETQRRYWRLYGIGLTVLIIVTSGAEPASATEAVTRCPAPPQSSAALADIDGASRLAFIRGTLDDQVRRSQIWKWAWIVAGSSLAGANFLYAARTSSQTDRADSIVGGAGSLLIPLSILIRPPVVLADRAELERRVAESTDRCAALARAEELLARDAESQARATGAVAHVTSIGSNVGVALLMGFGFGHWKGAAWAGVGGTFISEAYLFTSPRGMTAALERYRNGALSSSPVSARWSVVPLASRSRVGAQLLIAF
jgi:hypothetical protein